PAPHESRRAAAALERAARRDEPGRAATGTAADRAVLRAVAARAAHRPAGDHRLVADLRPQPPADARAHGVRPVLRGAPVVLAGRQDPAADALDHRPRRWGVLSRW